jgi:flagella basal body P-ring formation protein FlgA
MRRSLVLLLCLIATAVSARQDALPVRTAIEDFLQRQTQGLPGRVSFSVGAIEADNNLAPCSALDVSLPHGGRLWGNGSVVVRCQAESGWKLFVPVQVRVTAEYLVSARALSLGQVVAETDLVKQSGDLTELPDGVLSDPKQAIGRNLVVSLAAGRPLRADALRLPLVVQQGQGIKVISLGTGFQVSSDGRALNNAAAGQVVQVRLRNGKVVSGIARSEGIVEVSH